MLSSREGKKGSSSQARTRCARHGPEHRRRREAGCKLHREGARGSPRATSTRSSCRGGEERGAKQTRWPGPGAKASTSTFRRAARTRYGAGSEHRQKKRGVCPGRAPLAVLGHRWTEGIRLHLRRCWQESGTGRGTEKRPVLASAGRTLTPGLGLGTA